jgi:hypothetical protein
MIVKSSKLSSATNLSPSSTPLIPNVADRLTLKDQLRIQDYHAGQSSVDGVFKTVFANRQRGLAEFAVYVTSQSTERRGACVHRVQGLPLNC